MSDKTLYRDPDIFPCCTVGGLKAYIAKHKIPDSTPIYYQRIEDKYFKRHGWKGMPYIFEQYGGNPPRMSEAILSFQPNWSKRTMRAKKRMLVIEAHY